MPFWNPHLAGEAPVPLVKLLPLRANGLTEHYSSLSNATVDPTKDTAWFIAVPRITHTINIAGTATIQTAVDIVRAEENPATVLGRPVVAADSVEVPGGLLQQFDGRTYAEQGMCVYPELPVLAEAANGSLTLLGTYSYALVYRWIDDTGRIHRSAPSKFAQITLTGANQTVTVTCPCLRVLCKRALTTGTDFQIEIYRNTSAGGVQGTRLFLLHSMANNVDGALPDKDVIAYSDTTSDSALTTAGWGASPPIYTDGGILENDGPPAMLATVMHRNRLWGFDADFRDTLWFSKEIAEGYGVEFSQVLKVRISDEYGDIRAVASLDDKLIVFKEHAIYAVTGDGPDNLGVGPYPQPHRIATGLGTIAPRSVLCDENGVWFQTGTGTQREIMLLDRGLTVQAPAGPVEDYAASEVMDAVYLSEKNEVRFYTAAGVCLVWSSVFKQWFTWTGQTTVAACRYGAAVAQVGLSGSTIDVDAAATYTDPNVAGTLTPYAMTLTTSWISVAGITGRERVYEIEVIGEVDTTGINGSYIQVLVYYDGSPTVTDTLTLQVSSTNLPLHISIKPSRQDFTSFRLLIRTTTPVAAEEIRVSGMSLYVGIKKGPRRLPMVQTSTGGGRMT